MDAIKFFQHSVLRLCHFKQLVGQDFERLLELLIFSEHVFSESRNIVFTCAGRDEDVVCCYRHGVSNHPGGEVYLYNMMVFLGDYAGVRVVRFGSVTPVIVLGDCEFSEVFLTVLGFFDDG